MQTNAHRQNNPELCLQEFTFHKGQQGEILGIVQRQTCESYELFRFIQIDEEVLSL